jgi:4-hydroxy-tetrahydrodipicolinate reductase
MVSIGIIGSAGRMGKALAAAAEEAGYSYQGIDQGGDVQALAASVDVMIDFSSPAALEGNLDAAVAHGCAMVIGTTGLEERHHYLIDDASTDIAVLQTGNTSLGVTLLAHLVREAAARLDADWDIEIVEMHHKMKVDAPSGTALLLGEAAAEGRGVALADVKDSGRDGMTGARKRGDIGFAALRGGTVAGDHDVIFAGPEEIIKIGHHAENRMIFARGAMKAAAWILQQPKGRYKMPQVLGLD